MKQDKTPPMLMSTAQTAFTFTLGLLAIPLSIAALLSDFSWTLHDVLVVGGLLFAGLWGTLLLLPYVTQKKRALWCLVECGEHVVV